MPTRTQVEQETVERLRVALGITARHLRATDAGEGLTPTELSILATISRRGSLRLTELAEIERVNPTMLSRIAARLVEARLISREADADDRRAARVEATAAGIGAARAHPRAAQREPRRTSRRTARATTFGALLAALPALEALAEGLRRDAPGPSAGPRT